jgi:putative transposase
MLVAEYFLRSLIKVHGKHILYIRMADHDPDACSFIGLERLLHSSLEESITERSIEYFKYRTENFEEYCPCKTTYNVI